MQREVVARMVAWMARSLSCPLFSFSSWLQPEGHSRVCRVPPYLWLSALMPPPEARVKLSPAQTPAKPITASLDHRHGLSLQLLHSIHYAANSPSCSTPDSLFTPTFAPLTCLLIPRAGLSCSFAHADTQSAMQLRQSVIRLSFMQDT